jgi:FdrA protein
MRLSAQASRSGGVEAVSAMMATDRNKDLFAASGLMTPEIAAAAPNDLAIAIKGDAAGVDAAAALALQLLDAEPERRKSGGVGEETPATLRQAKRADAGLNIALVSVAGDFARYEAAEALALGMDVMLYSDNISLADELALKRLADRKGLLVMGPDCGTAIIDGTPLAFANRVRKGPVGVVGASGTGLQEVTCLLERMGVGIGQAYGAGGRDLKDDVGGITALAALNRLGKDPTVEALVILGKPPGRETRKKLLARIREIGKPAFVHYLGADEYSAEEKAGVAAARDLEELAVKAARHVRPSAALGDAESAPPPPSPAKSGCLHGIFGGGTLCQEAALICGEMLSSPRASNLSAPGYEKIGGSDAFSGHLFLDLGEDEFTVGRPHPMMAPDLKMDRIAAALRDPGVRVVLMDLVIGHGSHPRQAELAVEALTAAKPESEEKIVVASVTGTDADNPTRESQAKILREAGVIVLASNARAARWAARAAMGVTGDGDDQ